MDKPDNVGNKANIGMYTYKVRTRAYNGVKNVCFSKNLMCFVFLKHSFWNSPFYLITDNNSHRAKNYNRNNLILLLQYIYYALMY